MVRADVRGTIKVVGVGHVGRWGCGSPALSARHTQPVSAAVHSQAAGPILGHRNSVAQSVGLRGALVYPARLLQAPGDKLVRLKVGVLQIHVPGEQFVVVALDRA